MMRCESYSTIIEKTIKQPLNRLYLKKRINKSINRI